MPYEPYVPQDVGELLDQLAYMMLAAPTFKDDTGYFPQRNIDIAFFSLNEGLQVVRKELGDSNYAALTVMSDKMRALFESDPDDKTGDARKGRVLIREMESILTSVAKREARK
jgi:hypothetical protein